MLLAHCRGLLKPDYKYGLNSRAREKLILYALDCESEAGVIENVLGNEATWYAPHIDISKNEDYIRNTERLMKYAAEKRTLTSQDYDSMFGTTSRGVVDLVELYKQAEAAGIIDRFRKQVEQASKN